MFQKSESDKRENGWHETRTQMIAEELAVSAMTVQIPTSGNFLIGGREVPASFMTGRKPDPPAGKFDISGDYRRSADRIVCDTGIFRMRSIWLRGHISCTGAMIFIQQD